MTDIISNRTIEIKEKDFIKCRYNLYKNYNYLVGGIVYRITDSSIVYRGNFNRRKEIPISDITNIDRVPLRRNFVPAIVAGLIVGGADILINPKRSTVTTSLLVSGGIILSINYVYIWNHRQLNKNQVGRKVKLSIN